MAIEANRALLKQIPDNIHLNKENCMPHISLAMGCINSRDMTEIESILKKLAVSHFPQKLIMERIQIGTNAKNEKVSLLQLKKTTQLQSLHEAVMKKLTPFFRYDVSVNMILPPHPVSESTLIWIGNYPEKSSFGKFSPHITLGYGHIENISFPPEFTASQLALCHLGNHCTCRKILASIAF
ncbi:MAG: 2'-5' RNA ligase family protein [Sedimentisphaerales bacterium]|nr:2'-5' RNA ligase family protein [Sedimentisphaerales bacterium]